MFTLEMDDIDSTSGSENMADTISLQVFDHKQKPLKKPKQSMVIDHYLPTRPPTPSITTVLNEFHAGIKRKRKKGDTYLQHGEERESFETKLTFLLLLAQDISSYGVATHRLEYLLETVAESVGIKASFFVLPGMILFTAKSKNITTQTHLLKTKFGVDMGKLSRVNDMCYQVFSGRMDLSEATVVLGEIRRLKGYSMYINLITIPLLSSTLCIIGFQGTWTDAGLSFLLGIVVGVLQCWQSCFLPPLVIY